MRSTGTFGKTCDLIVRLLWNCSTFTQARERVEYVKQLPILQHVSSSSQSLSTAILFLLSHIDLHF